MIIITRYILLLDDDIIELNNTKTLIENDIPSISVITTNSYEKSIHYIDTYNQNIEAYILDIELSDSKFSGIDVAKFIRNDPKKALVPIIFTTSYYYCSPKDARPIPLFSKKKSRNRPQADSGIVIFTLTKIYYFTSPFPAFLWMNFTSSTMGIIRAPRAIAIAYSTREMCSNSKAADRNGT